MPTPISGDSASIHLLKAQQAWAARQAVRPAAIPTGNGAIPLPTPKPELPRESARIERADATPSPAATTPMPSRLSRSIPEIQDIARRAGFLGLTEQDIQRAYVRGESLLTDYRV
jgi:hypothetical protein